LEAWVVGLDFEEEFAAAAANVYHGDFVVAESRAGTGKGTIRTNA
jgi:hypothetical protein